MTATKPIASIARTITLLAVLGVLLPVPALASSATPPQSLTPKSTKKTTAAERALLDSPQLWATIDVCDPSDQPNTVGVRGSMPGDDHSKDHMYMSFRLQYINATTKQWVDLSKTTPAFIAVGAAKAARQGGSSFELKPVTGQPAFTMRGVVSFQWRRGSTVEYTVSRPTTAGHTSLTGADPVGFTAATCMIG
jgi:hypothetical protein